MNTPVIRYPFHLFLLVSLSLGLTLLPTSGLFAQFTEQANELGVQHVYTDFGEGAGVSLVDFNGDGRDDFTIATGESQFLGTYISTPSGLQVVYPEGLNELQGAVRSVNWIDFDNDGDKDLFATVLNYSNEEQIGYFRFFRQDPGFTFTDISAESEIVVENLESYGSAWADYDNDGFLDLYISNYGNGEESARNYMYRNTGDGTFEATTQALGLTDPEGRSFISVFFDADMDGQLDLFTANDRATSFNRFYRGVVGGSFVEESTESGLYTEFDAMGVDVGDYDNDGDLDLYVTNTTSFNFDPLVGNILFENDGDAYFTAIPSFPEGAVGGTFWGCNFIDFDYDRDLDLFTVNQQPNDDDDVRFMFVNDGTGAYDEYPGTEFDGDPSYLTGSAQGDLNHDGFLDIAILDLIAGTSQIWIGPSTDNGHISTRLEGTVSNRDGIGAVIEVWVDGQKRIDQTSTANSFASQDSDTYRFGLGASDYADSVIVRWPSGLINAIHEVPTQTHLEILESLDYVIDCIPQATMSYEPFAGLAQTLSLTEIVNANSADIIWLVEGDTVGMGPQIEFQFVEYGSYDVCALVNSDCTSLSICESIDIECLMPQSSFSVYTEGLLATVSDSSLYAEEIHWYVNEVSVGSGDSYEIEFPMSGTYEICLVTSNNCGVDTSCVLTEVSCITASPEIIWDSPDDLQLSALIDMEYDSVQWHVDGLDVDGPFLDYTYLVAGEYELCVYVWDACGSDSTCVTVEVACPPPVAEFSYEQDSLEIQIIDISAEDSLAWTLNGQYVELSRGQLILFPEVGSYELCMEAYNDCGEDLFCDSIFVDQISGLDELSHQSLRYTAWPNPAGEYLDIALNEDVARIHLFDMEGRQMVIDRRNLGVFKYRLALTHLEAGPYQVVIETKGSSPIHFLFVKE